MKPELAIGRIQEVIDGLLMALDFVMELTAPVEDTCIIGPEGVPHVEQAVEDLIALRKDLERGTEDDETWHVKEAE